MNTENTTQTEVVAVVNNPLHLPAQFASLTPTEISLLDEKTFIAYRVAKKAVDAARKLANDAMKAADKAITEATKGRAAEIAKFEEQAKADAKLIADANKFNACLNNFDAVQINVRGTGLKADGKDYWFAIDDLELRDTLKFYLTEKVKEANKLLAATA